MSNYQLDPGAFRAAILNAPWMVAEMEARAERAKAVAEGIAPVDEQSTQPGRYRDSFHVESGTGGGVHRDRAYAILYNDARTDDGKSLAAFVEYGTEHNEGRHVLGRALDAMG